MPLSDGERAILAESLAEQSRLEQEARDRTRRSSLLLQLSRGSRLLLLGAAFASVGVWMSVSRSSEVKPTPSVAIVAATETPDPDIRSVLRPGLVVNLWNPVRDDVSLVVGKPLLEAIENADQVEFDGGSPFLRYYKKKLPNLTQGTVVDFDQVPIRGDLRVRVQFSLETWDMGYVASKYLVARHWYTEREREILRRELLRIAEQEVVHATDRVSDFATDASSSSSRWDWYMGSPVDTSDFDQEERAFLRKTRKPSPFRFRYHSKYRGSQW